MPSYYENFPEIEIASPSTYQDPIIINELSWTKARELYRNHKSKFCVFNKMFIMVWAIQALFGLDKAHAESKAIKILNAERVKPTSEQKFGNFLAVLYLMDTSKNNSMINDLFYFISGQTSPDNNLLFNAMLKVVVDYVEVHQTELKKLSVNVLKYNAAPSGKKKSLLSYPSLESVKEENEEELEVEESITELTEQLTVQTKGLRATPKC